MFSQVVAGFSTPDKKNGCSPFLVRYVNESTGSGTLTYKWSFGNGATSTQKDPVSTYSNSGTYSVKLVVSNGISTDSIIKTNYIEAYSPPQSSFTPSAVVAVCAPGVIEFKNTSTIGSSAIKDFTWDFGDGFISSQSDPVHTYAQAGIYSPSLTIKDYNGCLSSHLADNQIKVYKPVAEFTCDIKESCEGQLSVKFTNLSSGSGKMNHLWNYGDGTLSTEKEETHQYLGAGNFNISLQEIDDKGCSDTIQKSNYIKITAVIPTFTGPADTICPNTLIQFTNTTPNTTTFNWNFGDGQTSTLQNPKHAFQQSGVYQVSLMATNGLCGGTTTKTVVVEYLKAQFAPSAHYNCQLPVYIKYTNTSINANTYEWHFGNKKTSIQKEPSVLYELDDQLVRTKQESFRDTLIITSKRGCKSISVLDSSVVVVLPNANFTPNPTDGGGLMRGCAPLTVNFKDISTYNSTVDTIAKYKWEFEGDAKPTNFNKEFTEVFENDASTKVTLTITTQLGCTTNVNYYIGAGHKQTPDFDVKNFQSVFCASERVEFINKSIDMNKISSSVWNWGDGQSSSLGESHIYTKTGPMSVTLQVSSYGCLSEVTKSNILTINPPIATFTDAMSCNKPFERSYTSTLIGASSYYWDLGDGTVIHDQPIVTHTYATRGDYIVSLTAINGSCTSSPTPKEIKVRDIKLAADITTPKFCPLSVFSFNSDKSLDVSKWLNKPNTATYLWDFGDGTTPVFTDNTLVNHSFKDRGNYKVTLVSKDENSCSDTLVSFQRIYKPFTLFTPVYLHGCMPIEFSFSNNSKADTLSNLISYNWTFGDGQTSTQINPTHQYNKWGNYNVSLVTTDNHNCTNELIQYGAVTTEYPNPKFVANDSTLCIGDIATFASAVPLSISSYLWTFHDGTTSTEPAPTKVFSADGTFDVQLYVVDKHGCDTLSIEPNFIKVQKLPVVDFVADPLTSNCYPTEVTFTDLSSSPYLGGWKWNFGDVNGFSYRQNPQHVYVRPGKFNVKLIAHTTYGCADSLIKAEYVNPKGPYAEIDIKDTICRDAPTMIRMVNPFNIYGFKWDVGDETVSTDSVFLHQYRNVGRFYPGLFLVSDTIHTCDKFILDTVYVSETLAKYKLLNPLDKGCQPYEISYSNNSTHSNQFLWSFGDNTFSSSESPLHIYPNPGTYTGMLSVKNEIGCTDSINLAPITVFPTPIVTVTPNHLICLDSSTLLEATGGEEYVWSPAIHLESPLSQSTMAMPIQTTRYRVLVTDVNGCKNQDSVLVTVQQYPVAPLRDSTIIVGESVLLEASSADIESYSWEPNYNISCLNCATPSVQPLTDTTYIVTVQDTAHCFTKIYSSHITIEHKYSVDVPTAFTPNGDGINDEVFVKGWGIQELITFRVFNRFGEMIFETNDINQGWNGEGNGTPQMGDTFQYIVKVRAYNNQIITKSGSIKIIK